MCLCSFITQAWVERGPIVLLLVSATSEKAITFGMRMSLDWHK